MKTLKNFTRFEDPDYPEKYRPYIIYLYNAGLPLKVEHFDEDWSPVGKQIRKEMNDLHIVSESNNLIIPTVKNPNQ